MASNLVPGTCKTGTIDPAGSLTISTGTTLKPGYVASVTQNPPSNVEAGLTQATSAYTTVDNSCAPIPDLAPTGAVATITTVGTVSTKADATYTAAATVVTPTGGTGCTLTYTVASNVASSVTLVGAGTGYEVLDTISVADDLGVQVSVATIT
tara:strand:+ start:118 stop:576 length:459 start_codon:yes stop_codon:yes gene_type:complete